MRKMLDAYAIAVGGGIATALLVVGGAGLVASMKEPDPVQCFHSIQRRTVFQQAATAREFGCKP